MSVAEIDLVSEIMLGQCPLHESKNNTDCDPTFGKNTSFNQVFTWFDVNLPDLEAVTKILSPLNKFFCTFRSNVLVTFYNTINRGNNNLLSAKIVDCIV